MFFDTHSHVNFNAYKDDGEDVLRRCLENGINVVNVGSQYSTSKRAVEYAHRFDPHTNGSKESVGGKIFDAKNDTLSVGVYAAIGIHPVHLKKGSFTHIDPWEIDTEPARNATHASASLHSVAGGEEIPTVGEQFEYEKYLELAKDEKVVAIGEIGLDYHHFEEGDDEEFLKNLQKETLIEFIKLANEVQKPVMLHCWDGYDDLLEILIAHPVAKKGIVHSFIGSYKTANKFIELGYMIGLNGIITYGESYDRLIKEVDLKNIVIETDCPYLTPRPLERGIRNEPLFVKEVAQKIADVKGISLEEVAEATTQNAKRVLSL
ncbi:MAG: Hydrolase, TatD family [Parcubacteria group bacterium GW2011_GWD2_38_11]|nr:MAG: Hydrolase, TatD family [Parcubacteria group bacterium GW2011_GWD2_38_11]